MSENRCVCCGEVIPEGRQCCPICVGKFMDSERKAIFDAVAIQKDGVTIEKRGTLEEITKWADIVRAFDHEAVINVRRRKE